MPAAKKKQALKEETKPLHVADDNSLDKYNELLKNGNSIIVLYYSPSCPHCLMMEPAWMDFERKAHPMRSHIARVRADYMPRIEGPKDIMGYPTIYHIQNGEKVREFNGSRDVESFLQFLRDIERNDMNGGKRYRRRRRKTMKKPKGNKVRRSKSVKRRKRSQSKK